MISEMSLIFLLIVIQNITPRQGFFFFNISYKHVAEAPQIKQENVNDRVSKRIITLRLTPFRIFFSPKDL